MRRGLPDRSHFIEQNSRAGICRLPRRFHTRQTASHDVYFLHTLLIVIPKFEIVKFRFTLPAAFFALDLLLKIGSHKNCFRNL
jgi:hypothetical protein